MEGTFGGATMVNGQGAAIAVPASPASSDRRKTPTPLLQADITGLEITRLLNLDGLHSPIIRTAISYWMSKQQGDTPMQRTQFDATEIPHLLPYLLLLEVVSADESAMAAKPGETHGNDLAPKQLNGHHHGPKMDFRYRVIGDVVLRYSRGNYTGRCFSEVDGQGPESEVWRICTAVAEQARPLLLCPPYVGPHHQIFYCESATMPLVDESGKTVRLLIACDFLPEASLGHPHHNGHSLNSGR
ncbi:MAG TPA: hypothetical protein VL462_00305 [Candidatus Nitrosotalea sp.]|jgi:hypothetical protein|nr:hypothetical protein [Candidatus Nitrosotalea sp.]